MKERPRGWRFVDGGGLRVLRREVPVTASTATFHQGPGAHPSGSPQAAHAGGGGVGRPAKWQPGAEGDTWGKLVRPGDARAQKQEVTESLVLGRHGTPGLLERLETDEELAALVAEKVQSDMAMGFARSRYQNITGRRPDREWSEEELYLRGQTVDLVSQWAQTSSDEHARAWALQMAAAERWGGDVPDVRELSGVMAGARRELESDGPLLRAFLDTMYQQTQADFAARGVTEVTVARGMKWGDDAFGSLAGTMERPPSWLTPYIPGEGKVWRGELSASSNPLSSWSASLQTAQGFAEPGFDSIGVVSLVAEMNVPVSRVLSSPFSGVGCLQEKELVLVGGAIEDVMWATVSAPVPVDVFLPAGGDD